MSIRVLLADDHKVILDGLCSILEHEVDITVVGLARNGREAVRLVGELQPDVAILDVTMPELNGIEATRQIVAQYPEVKVIALTMHDDRRFVEGMLGAGASGFLLKECAATDVVEAIHTVVVMKRSYLSPCVAEQVLDAYRERTGTASPPAVVSLTTREREVLRLYAEGHSTKDIAAALHLSFRTVATHRQHIMEKLHTDNLADLTKYAIKEGLTSVETQLSDREREVVQLIAEGNSVKHIADTLHVSPKTIEAHRQHVMDKLKITNIADLTKYAIREGLTSLTG